MAGIKKLGLKSKNITEEQKAKLKDLFPEVFTEDKIDFDKLFEEDDCQVAIIEIDEWLKSGRVKTNAEIETDADDYLTKKGLKNGK